MIAWRDTWGETQALLLNGLARESMARWVCVCQKRTSRQSFDYFIGAAEQRKRYIDPKRLRSLEIDDHLNFGGLLDRQVGRLLALEDTAGIGANRTMLLRDTGAVTH